MAYRRYITDGSFDIEHLQNDQAEEALQKYWELVASQVLFALVA